MDRLRAQLAVCAAGTCHAGLRRREAQAPPALRRRFPARPDGNGGLALPGGAAIRSRPAASAAAAAALLVCLVAGGCAPGGRTSAPSPLHHTFASPDALGRAVLAALADGDADHLASLALSELEFRTVVWPELPSSRPERGLPFDYVWGDLNQKGTNALRRLVARHGGRRYTLRAVAFRGETTPYETYRVHREAILDLLDEEGNELTLPLFGSILERDGEFKLFSYVVD